MKQQTIVILFDFISLLVINKFLHILYVFCHYFSRYQNERNVAEVSSSLKSLSKQSPVESL